MSYSLISYDNISTYVNNLPIWSSFTSRTEGGIEVRREGITSDVGIGVEITRSMYRLASIYTSPLIHLFNLIIAYKREGITGVSRLVEELISTLLKKVYSRYGLIFDGEISFFRLADAGFIDEDTSVYLVATYIAIDSLLEDLEEVEELGNEEVIKILGEIASKLQELTSILTQIEPPDETTTIEYHVGQPYQSSNCLIVHV